MSILMKEYLDMTMKNYKVNYSNELIKEYLDLSRRFKMLEDISINAEVTLYNNMKKENMLIKMKTSRNTLTTFFSTYRAQINENLKIYLAGLKLEAFSKLPDDIIPEEQEDYEVENFSKVLDLLQEDLATKDELLELNKLRNSFKKSVKI